MRMITLTEIGIGIGIGRAALGGSWKYQSHLCRRRRLSISISISNTNTNSIIRRRKMSSSGTTAEGETEAAAVAVAVAEEESNNININKDDDIVVQYVVLRRDLIDTWPMGSVVTQGCHASVAAIWSHKEDHHTLLYCSPSNIDNMHKVTLEVKGQTQLSNLSQKLNAAGVLHKLWIEQPENYPTCLATKPYPKSFVSSFFKKLKLCK